jgi:hypothetical protein
MNTSLEKKIDRGGETENEETSGPIWVAPRPQGTPLKPAVQSIEAQEPVKSEPEEDMESRLRTAEP